MSRALINIARGGKAIAGFLGGFASSLMGGVVKYIKAGSELGTTIARTVASAIVGGTASLLGGGKFANGAFSGAFVYLFNEMAGPTKEKSMAVKALKSIYEKSLDKGIEMGGFIYKLPNGSYGYLNAGTNATTNHLSLDPARYSFPSGAIIVATYHTHPALYDNVVNLLDTERFSSQDYNYGITHHVDMYLGTLGGTFAYTDNYGNQADIYNFFR